MSYVPLHVHSYYSLLDGLASPRRIIQRAQEIQAPAIALTDHGSIAGIVTFIKAAQKAGIKGIAGIELYVVADDPAMKTKDNAKRFHLTVLAKNNDGFRDLMRLVSETNRPDYFYRKPRISLAKLAEFTVGGNLICLSGCLGGQLSSGLFVDFKEAARASAVTQNPDTVRKWLRPDWQDWAAQVVAAHQQVFGPENFWVELQCEGMPIQQVAVECLRDLAKGLNLRSVATLDAHYACKSDADDQRILLCAQLHTTLESQEQARDRGEDTMEFFHTDAFYIYDTEEMQSQYTAAEIEATLDIAERIQPLDIGRKPCLPHFTQASPGVVSRTSDDHLAQLCWEGAAIKLNHISPQQRAAYDARLRSELHVIAEAGLADYFLIVWDVCNFIDRQKGLRNCRGSGAGSLVNYVLGITDTDPIRYGLVFERFYNASRNIPSHFDAGARDFMAWYGENFENLHSMDIPAARSAVAQQAKRLRRMPNSQLLRHEAAWVDEHNPRMWPYLAEQMSANSTLQSHPNAHNSHLAYAVGLTDTLLPNKPFSHVDGHISLPDIDLDVEVLKRGEVIEYLRQRWGESHVAQMISFNRLQGRAALQEVFRTQPSLIRHLAGVKAVKEGESADDAISRPADVCSEITKYIPTESAIVDDLERIRGDTGDLDYGILRWAVDHVGEVAKEYPWYQEPFDQAMRLEGTKKSQSRHPAGVIISSVPVGELVPLVHDAKTKTRVCGFEMGDAEFAGAVKFDFLGLSALDKLALAERLINARGAPDGGAA